MVFDSVFGQFMTNTFGGFDLSIFAFFGGLQNDFFTWISIALEGCGCSVFVIAIAAVGLVLCLFRPTRKVGLILGFSAIVAFILCELILNPITARLRPYNACQANSQYFQWYLAAGAVPEGVYSFPSKHAFFNFCVAIAMLLYCMRDVKTKKAKIAGGCLILVALLVSCSRIYLMVHYPTDVIVGIILGILFGLVVYVLAGQFNKLVNWFQKKYSGSLCFNLDEVYEKKQSKKGKHGAKKFNKKLLYRIATISVIVIFVLCAIKVAFGVNGHQEKCQYRGNDYACMNKADKKVLNEKTGELEDRCKLHK